MKKSNKILLIIFILILVLWFGSNLGLYLFTKYFVVGKESIELINKVPETINISYKETDGQKIPFGDLEFILPLKDYSTIKMFPGVYIVKQEVEKHLISFSLIYEYEKKKNTVMFFSKKPDSKLADSMIEHSNYTMNDFNFWNPIHNYNSFNKLASKWIMLPSNSDLQKYPLSIVNTQYFKGFLSNSIGKTWYRSSFDFSYNEKSYIFMLFGNNEQVITDDMQKIISSINPIEDVENITQELLYNYKNEKSIFEKQLALISLISIEGPTIENLTELKKLMIQEGARVDNIDNLQKQIEILKNNVNAVLN